jgi:enamine deaminase RidA (YjgF/YER057c/UK114 family)
MESQRQPPTTSAERRIQELEIRLPPAPTPFGAYVPTVQSGSLLFLSGTLPTVGHQAQIVGRLGKEVDVKAGCDAARAAALNAISFAKQHLGSLDRVTRVVRLGVYVAAADGFSEHIQVADAASELLRDVFGEDRMSARLVFGVASLPLGVPVELEVIFEVRA